MRVFRDDVICGVSAPIARELMRHYYCASPVEIACDVLGVGREEALNRLSAFEIAGYLEQDGSNPANGVWWLTTMSGHALAQASYGKPISRITARRHLVQVVDRARAYNADPGRLLTISEIAVFGCYLDAAAGYPGDLDLAVSVIRRDGDRDQYVRKVLAYARASGRRFDAFHELLHWPVRELRMVLKNRSPAITITDGDISQFTSCFEIIYAVSEDPGAIPLPPDTSVGAGALVPGGIWTSWDMIQNLRRADQARSEATDDIRAEGGFHAATNGVPAGQCAFRQKGMGSL
jgi:hypothetical protein